MSAQAVPTDTCPPHCAVVVPDACPGQDVHPCPEQTFPVDSCLSQGAATCLDACPQAGFTCPDPVVPIPGDSCAPPHVGACVCPAAIPYDTPQTKGGTNFLFQPAAAPAELCTPETVGACVETFSVQHPASAMDPCTLETAGTCAKTFPLQHIIPTVDLCLPDTAGTCVENLPPQPAILLVEPCIPEAVGTSMESIPLQYPTSAVEPCTLEVLETSAEEPCCAQGVITGDSCLDQGSVTYIDPCASQIMVCTEPRVSQNTAEPMGTCAPQGTAGPADTEDVVKGASTCPSSRAPFRPNTCTLAIVERCLSRCQNWLRGKK